MSSYIDEKKYIKATQEEVRAYQVKVLLEVDKFCKENNIKYFLYYGSLLGAIRHKGFIPWDDDIDIAMIRDDYDKFMKLFPDGKIKVYDQSRMNDYPFYFAKVCDTDTLLVEEMGTNGYNYGIGLDLFPLDKIPQNPLLKKKMIRSIKWRSDIRDLKTIVINRKRNIFKTFIIYGANFLLKGISVESIIRGMKKIVKKYSGFESDCVADIMLPYGERSIIKTSLFNEVEYVDFENVKISVPVEYDKILTQIYGDYMTPPPEDKRTTTHFFNAYIKR